MHWHTKQVGAVKTGAIVALAQRKGGVGKTTLSVLVAAELCRRGIKLALVDADPQMSACEWAQPGNLGFPVRPIALSGRSVSDWARAVVRATEDVLVIDTAPRDDAVAAAVALARVILIPCTPSGLDLDATARTLKIVDAVRARRGDPLHVILVPNRVDPRTLEGRQLAEELEAMGETVSPPIGNRMAFVRAFSTGQSIANIAGGTPADLEIRALCDLVERLVLGCPQSPRSRQATD